MAHEQSPLPRRTFIAGVLAATAAACTSDNSRHTSSAPASGTTAASDTATTAPAAVPTGFVSAGRRDRPQVALTFHVSGERALAVRMLDLLRERKVAITIFMVGSWLHDNQDLAARFLDDGHELANHTYTHLTFPSLDRPTMTSEVERCRDELQRLTGSGGRFFRPSGTSNGTSDPGNTVREVAQAAGYATIVGFDVDPSDYADPGAPAVAARSIAGLRSGSIVSLHFGHAGTIDALPQILEALSARSLHAVGLTALLS
jgi:peptidoglycan/xylan/chitin deacetylase (PgdA/CDA1 family)